jgi:hypothetical protein
MISITEWVNFRQGLANPGKLNELYKVSILNWLKQAPRRTKQPICRLRHQITKNNNVCL